MKSWTLVVTLSFLGHVTSQVTNISDIRQGTNINQSQAEEFLESYDAAVETQLELVLKKIWNMRTNISSFNNAEMVQQSGRFAQFQKEMRAAALQFNTSAISVDVSRQLKKITDIGVLAQPNATKVEEHSATIAAMQRIHGTAKVCLTSSNCLQFNPDITDLLATSRDYDTLQTLWVGWRNETGRKMRNLYTKYVQLSNEAVQHLGYMDLGEEWRSDYESETFVDDVRDLFEQVRPLYEQLHGYVRRRLKQVYGESRFPASGHIPAHILGNMMAQTWENILNLVKPFANKTAMDVTPEMVRQNYTADQIFRTAEDFFVSLGFERMVPSFWNLSMFEKPRDGRKVICHPVAVDFANKRDFRIIMCTNINQIDLMTAHHEMGHIVYYMEYKNQPYVYRGGANPGFHEAVGDVMTLSVQTPEHMKLLGLIDEVSTDNESDINFLMSMALQKVAFLPYGYLLDQWRWSVFSGQTTNATYNRDWWNITCRLQGISPPVERSEDDFDAAAQFHVGASVPYIRYFVSFIIQFQFHQAACQAAGYVGPLHRCDIYNNTQAGHKLRDMLKLGSSKPWPEAMKQLTGQEKMRAEPLLEYFQPLFVFLRGENRNDYGWDADCPVPT